MASWKNDSGGVPRWAEPRDAGMLGDSYQAGTPAKNAQRRIQRVGIAATGVAAAIWLAGAVWMWQVVA